jgi:hypothetical protein
MRPSWHARRKWRHRTKSEGKLRAKRIERFSVALGGPPFYLRVKILADFAPIDEVERNLLHSLQHLARPGEEQ